MRKPGIGILSRAVALLLAAQLVATGAYAADAATPAANAGTDAEQMAKDAKDAVAAAAALKAATEAKAAADQKLIASASAAAASASKLTGSKLVETVDEAEVIAGYKSRWISALALGVQFLPDYAADGKTNGLSKQKFFGMLMADGRFGNPRENGGFTAPFVGDYHVGVTVSMLGTAVARSDAQGNVPDEFNDVANSIFASMYLYTPMYRTSNRVHNLGPIVRAGAISRESVSVRSDGSVGDSVNWMYSLGAQYTYESFHLATSKGRPINGIPGGYIRLSGGQFEEYAGARRKWRLVADAALQVYPEGNLYFGVQGNFAKGPDEFMLVATFVRKPTEIAKLFSLGKDQKADTTTKGQ